jgi:glutamate-ammonia-ligase adenylyltransferase
VSRELSLLAEFCLQRAFEFVKHAMVERHGQPRASDGSESTLAVLGLGKLGGCELGYASDLDVVFVYSADGETDAGPGRRRLDNVTFMSRLAQRLMGGLHTMHRAGRLYEVDTRLRPSGSQGLLVSTLMAWERYHRDQARLWERQALTKLRAVAGDAALGAQVAALAEEQVYGVAPGQGGREGEAEIARAVHEMRGRIERELGGSVRGFDVKLSRGGLIDIEFAAQYLQLAHGHRHAELRTPSTTEVLTRAAQLETVAPDACALLAEAYDFMRHLEHRMRVVHDRSVQRLPEEAVELTVLARRAGFPDGESLRRAYTHWTAEVRRAYLAVLAIAEEESSPQGG